MDVLLGMVAQKRLSENDIAHATAIGIDVSKGAFDLGIRATLSSREAVPKRLVVVENSPARHAQIFSAPHDAAVLDVFQRTFDEIWDQASVKPGVDPKLRQIPIEQVAQALRQHVKFYSGADFELAELEIGKLQFLSNDVELFKLRRVASTNRIMRSSLKEPPLHIAGTPWGFFPPIVEEDSQGRCIVIDGVHRIYQARNENRECIKAIAISGVEARLPATPIYPWSPKIIPMKRKRSDRDSGYDEGSFRAIRCALENGPWTRSRA